MAPSSASSRPSAYAAYGTRLSSVSVYDDYAAPYGEPYHQTNVQYNIMVVNGAPGIESDYRDDILDEYEMSLAGSESTIRRPVLLPPSPPSPPRAPRAPEAPDYWSTSFPTRVESLASRMERTSLRRISDGRSHHHSSHHSHAPSSRDEVRPEDSISQASRLSTIRPSSTGHHHRSSRSSSSDHRSHRTSHHAHRSSSRGSTASHGHHTSHSHSHKSRSEHSHGHSVRRGESEVSIPTHSGRPLEYIYVITEEAESSSGKHSSKHHKKHGSSHHHSSHH
ncbi:hypothetical protein F5Y12DRAFT_100917 [Xylaria sp. FL1777]|nr:hypothetical protein F5Y12DRAFT_100917 [Xylaria sp. FL1777]